uniref:F-box domain-containing protein n=1 Tax=Oryza rufipogon TaxID=4529 RepID=A0A0E0R3P7_ORYRU
MEDNVLVSSKIHGRSKSTTAKRNCIICGQRISKRRRTQHNFQKISRGQLNLQRTRPCLLNFQSLPKDIVLRVMSKLTLKEVAQLSVVSTNWRQAWTFHPNLYFGIKTALGNNAKRKGTSSDLNCRISSGNKFIKRVDAILEKHCGTMVNKFAVKFGLSNEHANHVNGWVAFAIASKARVIILDFSPDWKSHENNYDFPCHIFDKHNGSYLEALRLDSVTLNPPLDFCGFANLKLLALDNVRLQHLEQLISKCHVLEWLSIQSCNQLHNLHVSEPLCRLQYLSIQGCHLQRMELHAPNLTTFEYDGSLALVTLNECSNIKASTIRLFDEKTLQNILTGIPSVLPHVETLYVEVHVKTQMSGFTQSPLKFTQLKCLTLEITFERGSFDRNSVFQLTNLFVAAPFLEDLYLDMYCSLNRCPLDLDDIVDQPHYHLKMVCIFGFCGNTGQVELAKCILRNALILEQMIIDPKGRYRLDGYFGRQEADKKLVPEDIDGVLTIL